MAIPNHSQETNITRKTKEMAPVVAKITLNHVTMFWQKTNTKCLYIGIPEEKVRLILKIDTVLLVSENRKNQGKKTAR